MTKTTRAGAGVSRYLRLYRVLSQALAEGRFGAVGPLPSEPRLMREYDISRSTVRRALGRLEAEGRIERRRGSGTFAREQRGESAASRDFRPVLDTSANPPAAEVHRTVTFRHIPTPAFLLGDEPGFGATTLHIRQIRYLEREPVVLETAYLPEEIGGGLTRRRLDAEGGAILSVLVSLGHPSASLEREFAALAADPLAANSLRLDVGSPVLNVRTRARDPQGRMLAHVNGFYRPDQYEINVAIGGGEAGRHRKGKRSNR